MRKRGLILFCVVAICLTVGAVLSLQYIDRPAKGTIGAQQAVRSTAADRRLAHYSDTFVSYDRPISLEPHPADAIVAPIIARQWYSRGNMTGWQLSVNIYNLPSGNLADLGDYHARTALSQKYSQTSIGSAAVFTDISSSSFSKVAFMRTADKAASISMTGGGDPSDDDLNRALEVIINSWRWQ